MFLLVFNCLRLNRISLTEFPLIACEYSSVSSQLTITMDYMSGLVVKHSERIIMELDKIVSNF